MSKNFLKQFSKSEKEDDDAAAAARVDDGAAARDDEGAAACDDEGAAAARDDEGAAAHDDDDAALFAPRCLGRLAYIALRTSARYSLAGTCPNILAAFLRASTL